MSSRRIIIRYAREPVDWHRFKNFGEDLMLLFEAKGWSAADWRQIDEPVAVISREVRAKQLSRVEKAITDLAIKHSIGDEVVVTVSALRSV